MSVGSATHGAGGPALQERERQLSAIGWGLFFVWLAIAFLADVGFGYGLLGVGIITLAVQAVRRAMGLWFDWFWIMAGGFFLLAAFWELFTPTLPFGPVFLALLGVALIVAALFGKSR